MALSEKHVNDICYVDGGSLRCRYLDEDLDDNGRSICLCKKLSPDRKIIDIEISEFISDTKKSGQDPYNIGFPLGDNCQGYIVLKNKLQGYDV